MTAVSLATLSQCTAQEVFDHVVRGLKSQGFERSLREGEELQTNPVCAYRGAHGMKCAAGWIIADDEYDPEFDGEDAGDWCWMLAAFDRVPDAHDDLIVDLQAAHDTGREPDDMRGRLRRVAKRYALSTAALDA